MKKTITILFLMAVLSSRGQGFLNQQQSRIKNLIKQIALFQIYIGYLQKGYDIAKTGLNTIGDIKAGDLSLHLDNFNSLKAVNSRVKLYPKIAAIILLHEQIAKYCRQYKVGGYVKNVLSHLLHEADDNIEALSMLVTNDRYEMKDDERIKKIDAIYADMQDKNAFAASFTTDLQILSLQELKEKNEVQTSRLLNNIKP